MTSNTSSAAVCMRRPFRDRVVRYKFFYTSECKFLCILVRCNAEVFEGLIDLAHGVQRPESGSAQCPNPLKDGTISMANDHI